MKIIKNYKLYNPAKVLPLVLKKYNYIKFFSKLDVNGVGTRRYNQQYFEMGLSGC